MGSFRQQTAKLRLAFAGDSGTGRLQYWPAQQEAIQKVNQQIDQRLVQQPVPVSKRREKLQIDHPDKRLVQIDRAPVYRQNWGQSEREEFFKLKLMRFPQGSLESAQSKNFLNALLNKLTENKICYTACMPTIWN